MTLSQLSNRQCPEPLIKTGRSVTDMLVEDVGLCTRTSALTRASSIDEFNDLGRVGQVLLFDVIYRSFHGQRRTVRSQLVSGRETARDSVLYPGVASTPRTTTYTGAWVDSADYVAIDHEINSNTYKPFRWKTDSGEPGADIGRQRTNPGDDLPVKTLTESETVILLYKWGVTYELTFEAMRNMSPQIDKLAAMIEPEGDEERVCELKQVLDVLEDGDGRSNAATSMKAKT